MKPGVRRNRSSITRRGALHFEQLVGTDAFAGVARSRADTQSTLAQVFIEPPRDLVDLIEVAYRNGPALDLVFGGLRPQDKTDVELLRDL